LTDFTAILGDMTDVKVIATGEGIRDPPRLRRLDGRATGGKWAASLEALLAWALPSVYFCRKASLSASITSRRWDVRGTKARAPTLRAKG